MNRLTARDEYGNAYYLKCFDEPCNSGGCTKNMCDFAVEVCDKLAAYEDTGLDPEQLSVIDEEYSKMAKELAEERKKHEWIPCSERLPEDCDNRFYMCVVESHEEDPPMYCQYEEGIGFGFWNDIYDEHTLGFIDSEFKTNEELGCEKVIAWMPLPEPYKEIEK